MKDNKYDPNNMESIMRRFEERDVSEKEKAADKTIELKSKRESIAQKVDPNGIPIIGQIGAMTREMEKSHIDAIALCRIMVERNPGAELWAIEILDAVANLQYFKVVNADVARKTQPVDMTEDVFQTMMVNSVTAQVKQEHNIPKENLFYCLFLANATIVSEMTPTKMHRMYMQQVNRLSQAMSAAEPKDPKSLH